MAIDYEYADLYTKPFINKGIQIVTDDGSVKITDSDFHMGSFDVQETLCSESQLKFGSCETSSVSFTISNVFTPLQGKWLTVNQILEGGEDKTFQIGIYKVFSDVPTADRRHREVTAYDVMYDILSAEVSDWYVGILPDMATTVTLKQFRDSFFQYLGVEQEDATLANDGMIVEKTIDPSELSGKDVIESICEINGCFGHIGRDGKFHYVHLEKEIQGLYPRNDLYPSDTLYPIEPKTKSVGSGSYIGCEYKDFVTEPISKLQIRQEENDIGAIVGTGSNCYVVEDNFLVYGKSANDLDAIAEKLYGVISNITYRPVVSLEAVGNPCLEVGDPIRALTKYELVETYILQRTLKGSQSLRDNYIAKGEKTYPNDSNNVNRAIVQLRGKTNILERTVEENNLRITDVKSGLETQIKQTADSITTSVSQQITETKQYADEQSANAKNSANEATDEKLKSYPTTVQMNSAIEQKADSITSTVSQQITETKQYADEQSANAKNSANEATDEKLKSYSTTVQMNSAIEQKADSITSTVSQQITETKQYADEQSANAKNSANEATDEKLKSYSTTVQMRSEIEQTAEGLNVEISKKVDDDTDAIITSINAKAGSVQIRTDNMDLSTNGWKILANGDFALGNGALTYVSGDKYIQFKNGLSLMLNGIPLSGQTYRFTNESYQMWDYENEQWVDISVGTTHAPRFAGTYEVGWSIFIVQYPYHTIIRGNFDLSAAFSQGYLFNNMFPPEETGISAVSPILTYASLTSVQINVSAYARISRSSGIFNIDGKKYYRWGAGSLITDRNLSKSASSQDVTNVYMLSSITYASMPIPLYRFLEEGYVYEEIKD